VNDEVQVLVRHALGSRARELAHAFGQAEVLAQLARGVVIAADPHDAHARLAQPHHALAEEEPGRVVAPAAVEEVARQEQELRALGEAELDQTIERTARGTAQLGHGRTLVALEPDERAVEVQIGRVNELRHGGSLLPPGEPGRAETSAG
jgi:hypothetical protein